MIAHVQSGFHLVHHSMRAQSLSAALRIWMQMSDLSCDDGSAVHSVLYWPTLDASHDLLDWSLPSSRSVLNGW